MVKILYTMSYIKDNITEYEKLLIDNIFQSICNNEDRESINDSTEKWLKITVYIKNLFKFLLAIHNISSNEKFTFMDDNGNEYSTVKNSGIMAKDDPGINIQYDIKESENKMQPYGSVDEENIFTFNDNSEIKEISSLYKIFLDNSKISAPWAYFGVTSPSYEKFKAENYSFKPKINGRSRSRRRDKSNEENERKTHAEILLLKGEQYK